ncbi:MAG TPA: T9SS type A sorting domain-containing protein, partial [Bacteroidales bacterium]|nr:T9SS type A sorting domain-containing protein [Bacteroidales bacterium]
FSNKLRIENMNNENFIICNILGQKVFDSQIIRGDENSSINTSFWKKGVYVVKTASKSTTMIIKQ